MTTISDVEVVWTDGAPSGLKPGVGRAGDSAEPPTTMAPAPAPAILRKSRRGSSALAKSSGKRSGGSFLESSDIAIRGKSGHNMRMKFVNRIVTFAGGVLAVAACATANRPATDIRS